MIVLFISFLKKVLAFLRTDLKAKNEEGESIQCIAILPEKMREQLKSKGVKIPVDFFSKLKTTYRHGYRNSSAHLFLRSTSSLNAIPLGKKWRTSDDCVYLRPILIKKTALQPSTLEILEKGRNIDNELLI